MTYLQDMQGPVTDFSNDTELLSLQSLCFLSLKLKKGSPYPNPRHNSILRLCMLFTPDS